MRLPYLFSLGLQLLELFSGHFIKVWQEVDSQVWIEVRESGISQDLLGELLQAFPETVLVRDQQEQWIFRVFFDVRQVFWDGMQPDNSWDRILGVLRVCTQYTGNCTFRRIERRLLSLWIYHFGIGVLLQCLSVII